MKPQEVGVETPSSLEKDLRYCYEVSQEIDKYRKIIAALEESRAKQKENILNSIPPDTKRIVLGDWVVTVRQGQHFEKDAAMKYFGERELSKFFTTYKAYPYVRKAKEAQDGQIN